MYSSCGHLSHVFRPPSPPSSRALLGLLPPSDVDWRARQHRHNMGHCHNLWWFALCASFCLAPLISLMKIRWKKTLRPNHAWQEKEKSWTEAILLPLSKYEFQKPAEICRMFIFWSSFPTWSLLSSRLRFASSSATAYHGMSDPAETDAVWEPWMKLET
jgi:hypothetical protein